MGQWMCVGGESVGGGLVWWRWKGSSLAALPPCSHSPPSLPDRFTLDTQALSPRTTPSLSFMRWSAVRGRTRGTSPLKCTTGWQWQTRWAGRRGEGRRGEAAASSPLPSQPLLQTTQLRLCRCFSILFLLALFFSPSHPFLPATSSLPVFLLIGSDPQPGAAAPGSGHDHRDGARDKPLPGKRLTSVST
jgi:hypothetical protein